MISMLYAVSCTFFVLLAVAFFSWSTEVKFILLILFSFLESLVVCFELVSIKAAVLVYYVPGCQAIVQSHLICQIVSL